MAAASIPSRGADARQPRGMTGDRLEVTPALVRRLVATQFAEWAGLPVRPVVPGESDNRTFRLGDHLKVRLPSAARYAAQAEKEHRWLPQLAPLLPLPVRSHLPSALRERA